MRANQTSYLSPYQPSPWLLVVLVSITGCQSRGNRSDSYASNPELGAADVEYLANASDIVPDVTQVAFDEPTAELDEIALPEASQEFAEALGEVGFPSDGDLSLSDVESLASHPDLAAARAQIESVRGQYVQAGLPFNPVLQYQSDEIFNDDSSGLHTLNVSQQFVTANKLGIAQQVQAQAMQKRQTQLQTAQLRVLTRVRAAFAQAFVTQRRVELTQQIVELSEKSVESVDTLLKAEEVSKVALLQARVEFEQARIAAENAATQLEADRRALSAATGSPTLPTGPLAGDIADGLTRSPWEQLLGEITTASPELSAAGSELERTKWALQLACAQVTPNVTGQVGIGLDTATDDTFATVGVSVPLPIRNRNQGNIRTARANVAAASAAIDQTRLSLQSRLAEALGRYQTAHQRYERLTENTLPIAEETFQLSQKAFDAGESSYLELLTAQRTLFNIQLSGLDAVGQARKAAAEIEGLLVSNIGKD